MNWGKGIVIVLALFMGFIIFLVVNLMMHKVDLESKDYYKREINFEQEILEMKNSNELSTKIELQKQEDFIVVKVPEKENFSKIKIDFLRPDNQKLDRSFQISGTKSYLIPKKELVKGKYIIEMRFEVNLKRCLQKDTLYI